MLTLLILQYIYICLGLKSTLCPLLAFMINLMSPTFKLFFRTNWKSVNVNVDSALSVLQFLPFRIFCQQTISTFKKLFNLCELKFSSLCKPRYTHWRCFFEHWCASAESINNPRNKWKNNAKCIKIIENNGLLSIYLLMYLLQEKLRSTCKGGSSTTSFQTLKISTGVIWNIRVDL